ncbi:MAG: hypothetical protein ACRYFR_18435 [Janthinobacterium lividum]
MSFAPAEQLICVPFTYSALLAKHGYSPAGYQAAVQEAVQLLLNSAQPATKAAPPTPDAVTAAVQDQLFHVVCAHIATPTLVLEQLTVYFAQGGSALVTEATLYLLQRLGPLQEPNFYSPRAPWLPAQS